MIFRLQEYLRLTYCTLLENKSNELESTKTNLSQSAGFVTDGVGQCRCRHTERIQSTEGTSGAIRCLTTEEARQGLRNPQG